LLGEQRCDGVPDDCGAQGTAPLLDHAVPPRRCRLVLAHPSEGTPLGTAPDPMDLLIRRSFPSWSATACAVRSWRRCRQA
jgi:hypothetical protein